MVGRPAVLSLRAAAREYGIPRELVRRMVADGRLEAFEDRPNLICVSRAALERVLGVLPPPAPALTEEQIEGLVAPLVRRLVREALREIAVA